MSVTGQGWVTTILIHVANTNRDRHYTSCNPEAWLRQGLTLPSHRPPTPQSPLPSPLPPSPRGGPVFKNRKLNMQSCGDAIQLAPPPHPSLPPPFGGLAGLLHTLSMLPPPPITPLGQEDKQHCGIFTVAVCGGVEMVGGDVL